MRTAVAFFVIRWETNVKRLDISSPGTRVMGVVNVTPDSFSDGGKYNSTDRALVQARRLVEEGADILDIGGESTRPGAPDVSIQEELERVIPVIEAISADETINVPLSIDTSKTRVMQEAIAAGVSLVNDVRALQDPGALECCAKNSVQVCLMHMQGLPRTMQIEPQYDDVAQDVARFLMERVTACKQAGISEESILLDPGFGFGKRLKHNMQLFRQLGDIVALGYPVLVGVSNKSMFKDLLGLDVDDRLFASLGAMSHAIQSGVKVVRVHNVKASRHVADVLDAINRITH